VQIVVILGVMRMLFALLSWLLHAVKWMLVVASIASLVTVGVKYLHSARPHVRLSTGRPVSQYAGNEGCAGLAGAEPHA